MGASPDDYVVVLLSEGDGGDIGTFWLSIWDGDSLIGIDWFNIIMYVFRSCAIYPKKIWVVPKKYWVSLAPFPLGAIKIQE